MFIQLGPELWWLLLPLGTVVTALRATHVRWTTSQILALGVALMFAWGGARPARFLQPAYRLYVAAHLQQYERVVGSRRGATAFFGASAAQADVEIAFAKTDREPIPQ